jgi:DDE superfamily endonuclease
MLQRTTYSGYKRLLGLKWQVIATRWYVISHIWPVRRTSPRCASVRRVWPGRILREKLLIDEVPHYRFGDSEYTLHPYLVTRFGGTNLDANELLFNKRISKAMVSVESAFKDIKKQFSTLRFRKR